MIEAPETNLLIPALILICVGISSTLFLGHHFTKGNKIASDKQIGIVMSPFAISMAILIILAINQNMITTEYIQQVEDEIRPANCDELKELYYAYLGYEDAPKMATKLIVSEYTMECIETKNAIEMETW